MEACDRGSLILAAQLQGIHSTLLHRSRLREPPDVVDERTVVDGQSWHFFPGDLGRLSMRWSTNNRHVRCSSAASC